MSAPPGHKLIAAWVPPEFARALAALARSEGRSRSRVLREAVTRYSLDRGAR